MKPFDTQDLVTSPATDFRTLDPEREFLRLYELEYGTRLELAMRLSAIAFCGAVLFIYTGWDAAIFWLGGYFAAQLAMLSYMSRARTSISHRDTNTAGALFLVVLAAFIWMPCYLLIQNDDLLQAGGAAGLSCILFWLLQRADTIPLVVLGSIATMTAVVAVLLMHALNFADMPLVKIGITCCAFCILIYYSTALLTARRRQIEAHEATQRSIEAHKMEAIGRLAGGVAHDFNNILTACMGNLDLYEEMQTDAERDDCVAQARLAASRGGAVIRKLLAYSRRKSETGTAQSVHEVLETLETISRPLIPAPIRLRLEEPQSDHLIEVDSEGLVTSLLNLVVNARDSMPGGGEVTVAARAEHLTKSRPTLDGHMLAAGDYFVFEVSDTGSGIPQDVLLRVLEPFFTTKPVGLGSGLGLPMVSQFARENGGGLQILTSPRGTRSTIYLQSRNDADTPETKRIIPPEA